MLSVRLDEDIEKSLNNIAIATQQSKSALIREAIVQYIEDKSDYLAAVAAMKKTQTTYPLDEVLAEFKDEL